MISIGVTICNVDLGFYDLVHNYSNKIAVEHKGGKIDFSKDGFPGGLD